MFYFHLSFPKPISVSFALSRQQLNGIAVIVTIRALSLLLRNVVYSLTLEAKSFEVPTVHVFLKRPNTLVTMTNDKKLSALADNRA